MSAAGAREFAQKARNASRKLQALPTEERVTMLNRVADALLANEEVIMAENKKVSKLFDRVNQHPCALIACQPGQQ
jgi:gamma-glutamyl phosphate reductase